MPKAVSAPKTAQFPKFPETPSPAASPAGPPALRDWALDNGVSVDWNPDTKMVTLISPDSYAVRFMTNNGESYGVGAMNAQNSHVVENERDLLKALKMLPEAPAASVSPAAPKPALSVSAAAADDYKLGRDADALSIKRERTVGGLTAKKLALESAYGGKIEQLYAQYMRDGLVQDERLAAKGLNGGYADAAGARRGVDYEAALGSLGQMKDDDLRSVDGAIEQAYQSDADALYTLETNYVTQLLRSAQRLEDFNYQAAVAAGTAAARGVIYR